MKSGKVQIVKVKPYPFPIELVSEKDQKIYQGQVQRVERLGVIVTCEHNYFEIGESLKIKFELPVLKKIIEDRALVIKSKVEIQSQKDVMEHVIEIHFKNLKSEYANAITSYTVQIGQKS